MERCSVCRHPQREAIEKALRAGAGLRPLGDRFAVSKSALWRHSLRCILGIKYRTSKPASRPKRRREVAEMLPESLDKLFREIDAVIDGYVAQLDAEGALMAERFQT